MDNSANIVPGVLYWVAQNNLEEKLVCSHPPEEEAGAQSVVSTAGHVTVSCSSGHVDSTRSDCSKALSFLAHCIRG